MPASTSLRPFSVHVPDHDIEDLRRRLATTRWPDPETVRDWSQGVRVDHAKALIDYWERDYDWRRFEAELNRFPQFLITIDGLDIHFIHVRSKNPDAMPLLLTHGWPGSVADFVKLVEPLTDPGSFGGDVEDSFDVVIPSLPGFGFSGKPTGTGWTVARIADAWVELMTRLGYRRWAAQGGDWGSVVTTALGEMRPEGLLGIHLNTQYVMPAHLPDALSPAEQRAMETVAYYGGELGGANHLQATKPETIGIALADSPAGQAAWIYDKFQSKTDNDGLAEDALSRDDILDAISLYWFTNTAASSARIYSENKSGAGFAGPRLDLPVAVTVPLATSRCSRATGSKTPTRTWSTTPKPPGAGTSPPSNNPSSSSRRSVAVCAVFVPDDQDGNAPRVELIPLARRLSACQDFAVLFADGAFGLILLGLWIFCLIDVITTDESRMRNLPKVAWIFIVLLFFDIGSIVWLVAGRPWESRPPRSNSRYPEYDRPGRHVAQNPDDDDEFLATVRARAESQRRQYDERRKRELDAERESLREKPDPDDPR